MTNAAVEVITSVQRRRRWSAAEKEQLVAAALEPGATVSAVARGEHSPEPAVWLAATVVRPAACGTDFHGGAGGGGAGIAIPAWSWPDRD
jgi:transposase